MTTKLTVFASIVLLTVATAASAQQAFAVAAPAQKAVTPPSAPQQPPLPVVTAMPHHNGVNHIELPHIELPQFEFSQVEFPQVEWADTQELKALRDVAQAAQQIGAGVAPFNTDYQAHSQIESVYSQARQRIDSNQYDRALEPLERVISAKGERADAAMYWKAYSLMKLARRDDALSTLGQLTKQFPDSGWVRDARALEVEVKQAAGQNVSADLVDDDTKLLALQGIMRTDPDAALPAVEKMLAGGGSVKLKDRALFVLSQSRSDKALGIISNVARTNPNPDLKQRAIRYLGQSNNPEAINTLTAVYRADTSVDTKKAVISALASSRNSGATAALVTLARGERNAELKTSIVRHLANSTSPEAKGYLINDILK